MSSFNENMLYIIIYYTWHNILLYYSSIVIIPRLFVVKVDLEKKKLLIKLMAELLD